MKQAHSDAFGRDHASASFIDPNALGTAIDPELTQEARRDTSRPSSLEQASPHARAPRSLRLNSRLQRQGSGAQPLHLLVRRHLS